jgi:ABC-type branched-subunit amino acid transport system ATPase component
MDQVLLEPGVGLRHHAAAALDVLELSARHGTLQALEGVSFQVGHGETTAVIGPNGSGKTTLLDCVGGLHPCTGTVRVDGWDVGRLRPHRRVALGLARSFQTPTLVPELGVLGNVALGAHHWGPSSAAGAAEAEAVARQLGLLGLAGRPVATLTHPERRLVEIARALVTRPRLLMLDEPAAGFGHEEGLALCRRVLDAAGALGCTVLLVEHDVPLVMALAAHVVVLHHGRVLAAGRPGAVRRDRKVVEAYLGGA